MDDFETLKKAYKINLKHLKELQDRIDYLEAEIFKLKSENKQYVVKNVINNWKQVDSPTFIGPNWDEARYYKD